MFLFVWLQELMGLDERVFACMYCGASFLHQSKLTRHILSHSLESLKYREQAAHLQLQAQLGLDSGLHLASEVVHYAPGGPVEPMDLELAAHSDPSSGVVLCKFCGKSFPDVGSLIAHLPAHTGDRPFKCEFCGKAFKLRHHMKDHCRVHTGERPFRCALCGKTFSRSTILKAHEKTHYPKYVRKFLSPSPVDPSEEEAPAAHPPAPPHH
nr:zinc finger protein 879-like [Neodiprion pinetum]